MRRLIILAALVVAAVAVAVPAYAVNETPGQKLTSSTTLDACGYFVGTQTANVTSTGKDGSTTEKGTWVGVDNNYGGTPVESLGAVHGSYTETTATDEAGTTTGTEIFRSNAGQITQMFAYGTGVIGGFIVSVTATGDLSFLTSDTNGQCYTGAFPRP
jgi:hypothetical protein